MTTAPPQTIGLVVFDWAGTLCDFGCLAPLVAFRSIFADYDVPITLAQARAPKALGKREHIAALLAIPEISARFARAHGRPHGPGDVDALCAAFKPAQLAAIAAHAELVPGALELVGYLRSRGIRVATTTDYFREAHAAVIDAARVRGLRPDHSVCADDVSGGLPAPWMIFACMQALQLFPPSRVVVVGDTAADMQAARNAGCIAVGVASSGREVGLSHAEWSALAPGDQAERLGHARDVLRKAGAERAIDTLAELPGVIAAFEQRGRPRRPRRRTPEPIFERLLSSRLTDPHATLGGARQ